MSSRVFQAGRILGGRYRLSAHLGSGGFSTVWRAHDEALGQDVALKILNPMMTNDEETVARFIRESEILERLVHPCLVRTRARSQDGELHFLVLDLIEGEGLSEVIERRSQAGLHFSLSEAADLLDAMAHALDYAHANGVVHRDLKPKNIMLPSGRASAPVVIVDFGVARTLGEGAGATTVGRVLGSLPYMAPEQVEGEAVDARADVFALATVFFEILTLHRTWLWDEDRRPIPFHLEREHFGTNPPVAIMSRILHGVPPRAEVRTSLVPYGTDVVLGRALSLDLAARTASAGAFAREFRTLAAPYIELSRGGEFTDKGAEWVTDAGPTAVTESLSPLPLEHATWSSTPAPFARQGESGAEGEPATDRNLLAGDLLDPELEETARELDDGRSGGGDRVQEGAERRSAARTVPTPADASDHGSPSGARVQAPHRRTAPTTADVPNRGPAGGARAQEEAANRGARTVPTQADVSSVRPLWKSPAQQRATKADPAGRVPGPGSTWLKKAVVQTAMRPAPKEPLLPLIAAIVGVIAIVLGGVTAVRVSDQMRVRKGVPTVRLATSPEPGARPVAIPAEGVPADSDRLEPIAVEDAVPLPSGAVISPDPLVRAREKLRAGQVAEAALDLERCVRSTPRRAECYRWLGLAQAQLDRKAEAARSLRRYLELSPEAPDREEIEKRIAEIEGEPRPEE